MDGRIPSTKERDKTDTTIFIILSFFSQLLGKKINLNLHRAAVLASAVGKLPQTWHNAVILLIRNNIVMSSPMLRYLAPITCMTLSRRNYFLSLQ